MSKISETEIKSMTKEQNYMRGYEDGKSDVLDKIRAEIQGLRNCSCSCSDGIIDDVEEIIDKYTAEKERV